MFAALASKSEFLKRDPRPPWGLRNFGATEATELFSGGHEERPKLGIFVDEQGPPTSVESLLKEATAHESLRTTVLSDTDKSC